MLARQFGSINNFLSRVLKSQLLSASILLLVILTVFDYLTGLHYGFSLPYLLIILLLTWHINLSVGITFSFVAIISWFSVRLVLLKAQNSTGIDFLILTGEAAIRLLFFLIIAYILSLHKKDFLIQKKQNEQLAELNNLKNYFVGIVAHDLRNPASIIEMSSSALLDSSAKTNLTKDQLTLLEMIYKKSLYMMKLIEDYLDIAKIEAGYLELHKGFYDYIAFIREIVALNDILAHQKNIHVEVQQETDIPVFSYDRNKVYQVVNNLLMNAINYSKAGLPIKVNIKVEDKCVVTEIIDSGPGIDAEDMTRLFETFYRSKKRYEKGTGLGLAISKKIVEAHGGKIGFRNNISVGSTFWFTLPLE